MFRFLSININGLPFWLQWNHKAELLKLLLKRYNVECLGLQETCINWSEFKASQTVASILRDGKTPIRSVQSYNRYETDNIGYTQRGGTATVLRDELDGYFKDLGKDETGLGMWSWYRIQGAPGCRTRIVSAYAPTGSEDSEPASYYKQIKRYIQKKGLRTTPKALFRDELYKELEHWRSLGDRIIRMMDANENVTDGILAKRLKKLGLTEAVHSQTPGPGPNTHIRGSQSIDGIWTTPEIVIRGASYLPFIKDLGNHRSTAMDVTIASLLGLDLPKIVRAKARRLNSQSEKSCGEYIG